MLSGLTSRKAFTALIAAFLLHNIEEAITICRYPVENPFPFIQPANCNQFIWAVSILSVVILLVFIFSMYTENILQYNFISTGIAAVLLFNVLIPHMLIGLYTFQYTPGLVSAVMLNLPLSLLVLSKNRPNYTSNKIFLRHIFTFLIAGYLLFVMIMGLVNILI